MVLFAWLNNLPHSPTERQTSSSLEGSRTTPGSTRRQSSTPGGGTESPAAGSPMSPSKHWGPERTIIIHRDQNQVERNRVLVNIVPDRARKGLFAYHVFTLIEAFFFLKAPFGAEVIFANLCPPSRNYCVRILWYLAYFRILVNTFYNQRINFRTAVEYSSR